MVEHAHRISFIIPTYNEAAVISQTLLALKPYRVRGHQLIVVDGGSDDQTVELATPLADQVLQSAPGRAIQMNRGAAVASGDVLIFVHADTVLPVGADQLLLQALQSHKVWGRFNVRLSGKAWMFRVIEWMMNLRSSITSVATGDQGIFVWKKVFQQVGGFPEIPLMEDVAISKRLRKHSAVAVVKPCLITSSRRWESNGIWRTMLLMWRLRLLYFFGAAPEALARYYR